MRRCAVTALMAVLALLVTACRMEPQDSEGLRADAEKLSKSYSNLPQTKAGVKVEPLEYAGHWWQEYGGDDLESLVDQAVTENFSIHEAYVRLKQMQALSKRVEAAKSPMIDVRAGADTQRSTTPRSLSPVTDEGYSVGLSGSYEVDLWGKIDSQYQAALLDAQASEAALKTAVMTIVSQLVEAWISLQVEFEMQDIINEQISTNREILSLLKYRYTNGQSAALDVYQQEQILSRSLTELPLSVQREKLLRNQIAILCGKGPASMVDVKRKGLQRIPVKMVESVPADLLNDRPDIIEARLKLEADLYRLTAAEADKLPSLRISGTMLLTAGSFTEKLDQWIARLAAELVQPLIDGGLRDAEIEYRKAAIEASLNDYKYRIILSVKDVEDALIRENTQRDYIKALDAQVAATNDSLVESRDRYLNGLSDYLPVVTALVSLQTVQQSQIYQKGVLYNYRIGLYRALGGAWVDGLTELKLNERTAKN